MRSLSIVNKNDLSTQTGWRYCLAILTMTYQLISEIVKSKCFSFCISVSAPFSLAELQYAIRTTDITFCISNHIDIEVKSPSYYSSKKSRLLTALPFQLRILTQCQPHSYAQETYGVVLLRLSQYPTALSMYPYSSPPLISYFLQWKVNV